MLSKPPYILWLPMMSSHFCFRDISLDQWDDMLKTFLLVNLSTESTSTLSVALQKSIMKLIIVWMSYALLESQWSIMFRVGIILHLVGFCYSNFCFGFSIRRFKVYDRRKETVNFFSGSEPECVREYVLVFGFLSLDKGRYLSRHKVESISSLNPVKLLWGWVSRL